MLPLGLSGRELALGRLQIRFRSFHLRRRGQSLSLRIIHLLLRDQSRLRFSDAVQSIKLQLHNLVRGFYAAQFVFRVHDLIGRILDGGIVLFQLRL